MAAPVGIPRPGHYTGARWRSWKKLDGLDSAEVAPDLNNLAALYAAGTLCRGRAVDCASQKKNSRTGCPRPVSIVIVANGRAITAPSTTDSLQIPPAPQQVFESNQGPPWNKLNKAGSAWQTGRCQVLGRGTVAGRLYLRSPRQRRV